MYCRRNYLGDAVQAGEEGAKVVAHAVIYLHLPVKLGALLFGVRARHPQKAFETL